MHTCCIGLPQGVIEESGKDPVRNTCLRFTFLPWFTPFFAPFPAYSNGLYTSLPFIYPTEHTSDHLLHASHHQPVPITTLLDMSLSG